MTVRRLLCVLVACGGILLRSPAFAHDGPVSRLARLSHDIQGDPTNPQLFILRGEEYRISGHWTEAAADYEVASALGADPGSVALCRAALFLDQGRPEAALETLIALEASPANLALRGDVLARSGHALAAQAAYTEALDGLNALPPARRLTPAATALAARLRDALSVTHVLNPEERR